MEKHERLRHARIKAGFTSAAIAARRLGVPYGTYSGHENGLRGIKDKDAFRYAKAFGVTPNWLIFGDKNFGIDEFALFQLGTAGQLPDGEVSLVRDGEPEPLAFAAEPFFPPFSAFVPVTGPYLRGIADEGCYLICSASFDPVSDSHIDQLCLCRMEYSKIKVRYIRRGRMENRYDLDALLFPPAQDQKVYNASIVHAILLPSMVSELNKGMRCLPSDSKLWDEFFGDSGAAKKDM